MQIDEAKTVIEKLMPLNDTPLPLVFPSISCLCCCCKVKNEFGDEEIEQLEAEERTEQDERIVS